MPMRDLPDIPLVSTGWLVALPDQPGRVIVDTREGNGYASTHTSATHRFRSAAALCGHFIALGLRPEPGVIIYCHGGSRVAYSVLALRLAGSDNVRNYEGSWAEWSRQNMSAVIEALPPETNKTKSRTKK